MTGPCQPYITADELAECCDVDSDEDTSFIREAASAFLFYATGQKYPGICDLFIRPTQPCAPCGDIANWHPTLIDGTWFNCMPCVDQPDFVNLGHWDTCTVEAVFIDGVELDPSEYFLLDHRLYRRSGSWPMCNDPTNPAFPDLYPADVYEGTFGIHLIQGLPAPSILKVATRDLACHFRNLCPNADNCGACGTLRQTFTGDNVPLTFQFSLPYVYTGITTVDWAQMVLNKANLERGMGRFWAPESPSYLVER